MDQEQVITDESAGRYFHFMLNMADDDLDVYEYRLLGHYRRACGANNKPCTEVTRTTAAITKMAVGKVSQTRQALASAGWIRLHEDDSGKISVTLIDRMAENVARYAPRSPHEQERSPHEQERSPHEQERSCGERKNQHIKKQQLNQPIETTTATSDLDHVEDSPTPDHAAAGDEWDLIQEDLSLHGVSSPALEEFQTLGAVITLAWLKKAESITARNPIGVVIAAMRNGEAPPDNLIESSKQTIELRKRGFQVGNEPAVIPTLEQLAAQMEQYADNYIARLMSAKSPGASGPGETSPDPMDSRSQIQELVAMGGD